MEGMKLTVNGLADTFKDRIMELQGEPAFQWGAEKIKYAVDKRGEPRVKLSIGNVPLDYDLWKGLRNPAVIGLYPAGLREIWEFYANRRKDRIDESGRRTLFQVPRSYEFAHRNYGRAVIISVMLPFSSKVIGDYAQVILRDGMESSHIFSRMYKDINLMIDKATNRVAIDLFRKDNVVVAMDNTTVTAVSKEAIPPTHQGASHGPSKGVNYPQKSISVLMGLGQFGISKIVFRDEIEDGKVQRFVGPLRSIIIFDKEDPVMDGEGGIIYPTESWRKFLFNLYDFTNTDPNINSYRFCTYIPQNDVGCGKCIGCCTAGAQVNSAPAPDGSYPEQVSRQTHRFWEGKLQFDFGRCCDERGQIATMFPEWSCAKCVSVCAAEGNSRAYAAENFYEKMHELTKE